MCVGPGGDSAPQRRSRPRGGRGSSLSVEGGVAHPGEAKPGPAALPPQQSPLTSSEPHGQQLPRGSHATVRCHAPTQPEAAPGRAPGPQRPLEDGRSKTAPEPRRGFSGSYGAPRRYRRSLPCQVSGTDTHSHVNTGLIMQKGKQFKVRRQKMRVLKS